MAPKTNVLRKTTNELQHIIDYEEEKERLEAIYADRHQKLEKARLAGVEAHKLQKAEMRVKRAEEDVADCSRRLGCHYGRVLPKSDVQINTPLQVKLVRKLFGLGFTGTVWLREDARRYEAILRAASRENVTVYVIRRR